ncbi:MAG TPA: T9SS type A sorting domain-containing protein [Bacteroidota bacterium]|nr:T9SS type A sorting domain-containing protein [Bacteroidota bacterium]
MTARFSFFTSKGDTIFASDGFWCRGVFRSTDAGASWSQQVNSPSCANGLTITSTGYVFAATGTSGVYRSTDWGANWTPVNSGLTNFNCSPIVTNTAGYIFVGTVGGGVFRSTNQGGSWSQVNNGLPSLNISALGVNSSGHIFAGVYPSGGIFRSTNNGDTWTVLNAGIIDSVRNVVAILQTPAGYLWISVSGLVYRSINPLVSVRQEAREVPVSFWLGQNYPNPFNPNTTVQFALPSSSSVSLKVFDSIGREVATILDDRLSAGRYKVEWNAQPFASGTYFYRLQAGSFVETKKLVVLR